MKLTTAIFVVFCAGICALTNGYRILGVFPTQCKSHWIIGHSVMKSLAKAGHSVTIISPFPLKTPIENYHDVSLDNNEGLCKICVLRQVELFMKENST